MLSQMAVNRLTYSLPHLVSQSTSSAKLLAKVMLNTAAYELADIEMYSDPKCHNGLVQMWSKDQYR